MNPSKLQSQIANAVKSFWQTRHIQADKQKTTGKADQGSRSAVTGGAQMDGFVRVIYDFILSAGVSKNYIFTKKTLELPGYFRPTKEWDLLVVKDHQLIAAIEVKSQVGPSFGNNFNNRTEEAIGSAVDLWTAYREGAFNRSIRPWLGYLFLLEDCEKSRVAVKVKEPHFEVFAEYKKASYAKRYELFCRRLIRERHYDAAVFLTSEINKGSKGIYLEPGEDLTADIFFRSLTAHLKTYK